MSRYVRIIVVNSDPHLTTDLRSDLLSVKGVKIVAEVEDPALLGAVTTEHPAEVVFVNLDLPFDGLLNLIRDLAYRFPDLSIFGISQSDDSRLILEAMRSGMREFFVRPLDRIQLIESLDRQVKLKPASERQGRLVGVVCGAGGVGGTILATNLACELTALSKRGAVLVDLNPWEGHSTILLDLTAPFTLADLCKTQDPIDLEMVAKALIRHDSGLHVLAAPAHFLHSQPMTLEKCAVILNHLTDLFEYVVCDGPPRANPHNRVILEMADVVLIVMTLTVPCVRNTEQFLRYFESEGLNPDRLHLVVNRYEKESSHLHPSDIELSLGKSIAWILPDDRKMVNKSINMGRPLYAMAGKSKVAEIIRQMARKIHEPPTEPAKGGRKSGSGFLAKVLGR